MVKKNAKSKDVKREVERLVLEADDTGDAATYRRALALDPSSQWALYGLACAIQDYDEPQAKQLWENVVAVDTSRRGEARYHACSHLALMTQDIAWFEEMEATAQRGGWSVESNMNEAFGLCAAQTLTDMIDQLNPTRFQAPFEVSDAQSKRVLELGETAYTKCTDANTRASILSDLVDFALRTNASWVHHVADALRDELHEVTDSSALAEGKSRLGEVAWTTGDSADGLLAEALDLWENVDMAAQAEALLNWGRRWQHVDALRRSAHLFTRVCDWYNVACCGGVLNDESCVQAAVRHLSFQDIKDLERDPDMQNFSRNFRMT